MMERRKLGALEVSAIGLGCMSMTPIYGVPDAEEAIATLHRAPEIGIDPSIRRMLMAPMGPTKSWSAAR